MVTAGGNDGILVAYSVIAFPALRPMGEALPANNMVTPVRELWAVVVPGYGRLVPGPIRVNEGVKMGVGVTKIKSVGMPAGGDAGLVVGEMVALLFIGIGVTLRVVMKVSMCTVVRSVVRSAPVEGAVVAIILTRSEVVLKESFTLVLLWVGPEVGTCTATAPSTSITMGVPLGVPPVVVAVGGELKVTSAGCFAFITTSA